MALMSRRFLPFRAGGREYAVSCESVIGIVLSTNVGEGVPVSNELNASTHSECVLIGRAGPGVRGVFVDAVGEPTEAVETDVRDGFLFALENRDTRESP